MQPIFVTLPAAALLALPLGALAPDLVLAVTQVPYSLQLEGRVATGYGVPRDPGGAAGHEDDGAGSVVESEATPEAVTEDEHASMTDDEHSTMTDDESHDDAPADTTDDDDGAPADDHGDDAGDADEHGETAGDHDDSADVTPTRPRTAVLASFAGVNAAVLGSAAWLRRRDRTTPRHRPPAAGTPTATPNA